MTSTTRAARDRLMTGVYCAGKEIALERRPYAVPGAATGRR
jgi:hypothetical protein